MSIQPVLIDGEWITSTASKAFQAVNPATREPLADEYPVSDWDEVERAIHAADAAFRATRGWPGERFAKFLERFADNIESRAEALVVAANLETALPASPRLGDVELPRTTNQLRQAAAAARDGSWSNPTIDTNTNIRSMFGPIGPVAVFGPNNFPFAFNSVAGGDFAAAVAAGNPVIAKGHSSHPQTTRLLAEAAHEAAKETEMPSGFVQLIYRTNHEDGEKLVSHPLMAATGYTGARGAGLVLKQAADRAGKPIYLELSSINPVFYLEGALTERLEALADEFSGSCLMGTGQFCTNPGLVVVPAGDKADEFVAAVTSRFGAAAVGTMLGEGVQKDFEKGITILKNAGAEILTGGEAGGGNGFSCANTLLCTTGQKFLEAPETFQTEAFGNSSLIVIAEDIAQMVAIADQLEGNLTGCIYSDTNGGDDDAYDAVAPALRRKVGRLLNDKMPTGVAVSAAMNHGGPYPATGHAGFTAVGIPASISRFAMLECYDNIRPHRLPDALKDENPGETWRLVDGAWSQGDV
ncbi:MAG: aldehyde dehydrogenase (NADP(+)) [Planctomycetaceae bacterium]|jgi:2,5-dioxopentanoate dehydrogenase|nr:aldehyde dehydrogenase (NADP(+)) [Planctomycetaceae bacterium]MBT6154217.1 aldehyde dehydrogenase (NADP(+)) [Planctomycetaceae bacterium]MBT6485685.1 aldehyde dehydrogenase (NADP(+)) [Planctomycetaceae bacterium]MBT6497706.1 aldehyde dehydrogenase (NADP(+)) [Planctomycetaceae bacterium]